MPKKIMDPVSLGSDASLTIARNEAYVAEGEDSPAVVGGYGLTIHVAGTARSEDWRAVTIGPLLEHIAGNVVRIADTGVIKSLGSDSTDHALSMHGGDNTVVNHGRIESASGAAISMFASTEPGTTTIANGGTISGALAIMISTTDTVTLTNTGTVRGIEFQSYRSLSSSSDHITNKGEMIGDINLGQGDDVYAGRAGTVRGRVSGDAGDDLLTGGSEKNELRGDDGVDRLAGGRGGDMLAGGSDADTFIFASARDSSVKASDRDLITDFSQTEADVIDLGGIDANADKRGNQAFKFIADDDFHGKAGELRYEFIEGKTIISGDTDGDGKANFSIALDGEIALTSEDFVL